ncbi:MAG: diaminopimelate epimerase [Myxococcota bacterium]|jgi:diaminopimelate epimerase
MVEAGVVWLVGQMARMVALTSTYDVCTSEFRKTSKGSAERVPPQRDQRPGAGATFFKAHGHGNDYLVFPPGEDWMATSEAVRIVCDQHRGLGADGVVIVGGTQTHPTLRMFNPDGGEFERSGNGLRVAALALRRWDIAASDTFVVGVGGGDVTLTVHGRGQEGAWDVAAELGRARVGPEAVQMDVATLAAEALDFVAVSVGNPHVVVFTDDLSDTALHKLGPYLATHPALANGTNVQLAGMIEDGIRIRIWERGVGPTSASGTSASAVAVAAVHSGRVEPGVHRIEMDGGEFTVAVDASLDVVLRGPIQEIAEGRLTGAFLEEL